MYLDGKPVDGLTLNDVVSRIRGKADTDVTITWERTDSSGATTEMTQTIKRKQVVVKAATHKDLGNGVHYVKLRNFVSQFAVQEMADALNRRLHDTLVAGRAQCALRARAHAQRR